jgi:hypothetical protein
VAEPDRGAIWEAEDKIGDLQIERATPLARHRPMGLIFRSPGSTSRSQLLHSGVTRAAQARAHTFRVIPSLHPLEELLRRHPVSRYRVPESFDSALSCWRIAPPMKRYYSAIDCEILPQEDFAMWKFRR